MPLTVLETATWEEVAALKARDVVVVLPTGSLEQHGPHLPISTDSRLVSEVARRAGETAASRRPGLDILLLPVLMLGRSPHHLDFPGSLSLKTSTYVASIEEISACLFGQGFRRLLLLNGHGANTDYLRVAARNVRDTAEMLVAVAPYWTLAQRGIAAVRESPVGGICHACEMETSLMLHLDEASVRKHKIQDEVPRPISPRIVLDLLAADVSVNHNVRDFSESGVLGSPSLATKEKGRLFLDAIVDAVAEFLIDFARWDLENLGGGKAADVKGGNTCRGK
jgi:creatinine amidohydrolase